MAEAVIAEVRIFVSWSEEEGSYRASVFAGPNIGPEDHRLQREEFLAASLDDATNSALAWVKGALEAAEA